MKLEIIRTIWGPCLIELNIFHSHAMPFLHILGLISKWAESVFDIMQITDRYFYNPDIVLHISSVSYIVIQTDCLPLIRFPVNSIKGS